jgi:hypothetical protein
VCNLQIFALLLTGEKSSITRCFDIKFYVILVLYLCFNFSTILIIFYGIALISINILPFIFDNTYRMLNIYSTLVAPEDGCGLWLEYVGALKPVVQLLVCKRQLHGKCTILNFCVSFQCFSIEVSSIQKMETVMFCENWTVYITLHGMAS